MSRPAPSPAEPALRDDRAERRRRFSPKVVATLLGISILFFLLLWWTMPKRDSDPLQRGVAPAASGHAP